jgi:hypothetical protein
MATARSRSSAGAASWMSRSLGSPACCLTLRFTLNGELPQRISAGVVLLVAAVLALAGSEQDVQTAVTPRADAVASTCDDLQHLAARCHLANAGPADADYCYDSGTRRGSAGRPPRSGWHRPGRAAGVRGADPRLPGGEGVRRRRHQTPRWGRRGRECSARRSLRSRPSGTI